MKIALAVAPRAESGPIWIDTSTPSIQRMLSAGIAKMFQSGEPLKFDAATPELINGRS